MERILDFQQTFPLRCTQQAEMKQLQTTRFNGLRMPNHISPPFSMLKRGQCRILIVLLHPYRSLGVRGCLQPNFCCSTFGRCTATGLRLHIILDDDFQVIWLCKVGHCQWHPAMNNTVEVADYHQLTAAVCDECRGAGSHYLVTLHYCLDGPVSYLLSCFIISRQVAQTLVIHRPRWSVLGRHLATSASLVTGLVSWRM